MRGERDIAEVATDLALLSVAFDCPGYKVVGHSFAYKNLKDVVWC